MASKKIHNCLDKIHVGTEGNESADKAARQGAENKSFALQLIGPYCIGHIKEVIDNVIQKDGKENGILHPTIHMRAVL